jgi:DNA modification methylase
MANWEAISDVIEGKSQYALLLGDNQSLLSIFPGSSVDCVITSPPYWQMREYEVGESSRGLVIGNEDTPEEYTSNLLNTFRQVRRVLKPTGSLWLNIGDKFVNKNLMGMPWRVALALQSDGWILRNDVIWEKMKGSQPVTDRFRNSYEHFFHFVRNRKYYFCSDAILSQHRLKPRIGENSTISATGVSGKKYRSQIAASTALSASEKRAALKALEEVLQQIRNGEVVDFRMTIRGVQRTYHSNRNSVSGRAKELEQKGFFILKSKSKGYIPSDIWRIAPEDDVKDRTEAHYAVFPPELLEIPIKATCPPEGIVLDPFGGIGSTVVATIKLNRRGISIDISEEYVRLAKKRLERAIVKQLGV